MLLNLYQHLQVNIFSLFFFFCLIPYPWVFKGLGNLLCPAWQVVLCAGFVLGKAVVVCPVRSFLADRREQGRGY